MLKLPTWGREGTKSGEIMPTSFMLSPYSNPAVNICSVAVNISIVEEKSDDVTNETID